MIRNKNVLITGASSGIGEALAVYYAQNGADNLFICGRNAERLAKVREACERYGAKVSAEVLDVTQREAVKNWVERCNVSANLNIVIANAGTGTINETEEAVLNSMVCAERATPEPSVPLSRRQGSGGYQLNGRLSRFADLSGIQCQQSLCESLGRSAASGFKT